MIRIRRVLCPTDFSEISERALDHAVALTRWYQASLLALHVVPRVPAPAAAGTALLLQRTTADRVAEGLDRLLAPAREARVPVATLTREGRPAPEILDTAREREADLLVMGTHGRGGFERAVLGSVTGKVVRGAACPVLTVPPTAGPPRGPQGPPFKQILCPVDFSEASLPALELALSLAQETDAGITVLNVVDAFAEEPFLEVSPDLRAPLEDEARRRLEALVPVGARDWCHPRELVTLGKPWREILRVAREEGAEVVVMGACGGGALERPRFGLTAQAVSRQASCPVLTVRPAASPVQAAGLG